VTEENNLYLQTEYRFMQIFFLVNAKLEPATKRQAPTGPDIALPLAAEHDQLQSRVYITFIYKI